MSSGVAVLDEPAPPRAPDKPMPLAEVAKNAAVQAERIAIEEALHRVHWNRRKAAVQLGVSYKTLLNKIKECGISRK
jgi:DNA-binding NtrC family response regulator